jgi:hypothetical protein
MRTKEQVKQEQNAIHAQLERENFETLMPKLKSLENELKEIERAELLSQVNAGQSRLRELARQAYECEQPGEDITCTDGSFHKTKIKKYPKIAALQYASASWEDGKLLRLRINGEKFEMYRTKYEYGKPNEYTRPGTFADFLELNNIMPEPLTMDGYLAMCSKLEAANAELDAAIENYRNKLTGLQIHSFSYWRLVSQSNTHLHKYAPNK